MIIVVKFTNEARKLGINEESLMSHENKKIYKPHDNYRNGETYSDEKIRAYKEQGFQILDWTKPRKEKIKRYTDVVLGILTTKVKA